jgi:hypothetical protein
MIWVVRLSLVAAVAAGMAVAGELFVFGINGAPSGGFIFFAALSIAVWLVLALAIHSSNTYVTAIAWGLFSPLIGATFIAPPISYLYVFSKWYACFPVGIATGLLVKFCVSLGGRPTGAKPPITTSAEETLA